MDADIDEGSHRAFHRRRWFRKILIPCTISLALFVAGFAVFVIMPRMVGHPQHTFTAPLLCEGLCGACTLWDPEQGVWNFELWRLLLFVGGTVPLYGISKLVVHLLVVICESYPPARGAIYYVIGIKACACRLSCLNCKQQ